MRFDDVQPRTDCIFRVIGAPKAQGSSDARTGISEAQIRRSRSSHATSKKLMSQKSSLVRRIENGPVERNIFNCPIGQKQRSAKWRYREAV
jgi:hypothetical protein